MQLNRRRFLEGAMKSTAAPMLMTGVAQSMLAQQGTNVPVVKLSDESIPHAAQISITDLLDHGVHLKSGQSVLLVAYLDGLYGGDNLVDRDAIRWIGRAVEERGNKLEVLWVDQPGVMNEWKFPDVVRAAMERNDVTINHSFDLTVEDIYHFREFVEHQNKRPMCRNFATTSSLLCTYWAQTPQELVSEIRYQASLKIVPGQHWVLTDPNGTHLEGVIRPARHMGYASRRESGSYLPWPEWVVPPISLGGTNGIFTFDRTLSWWSRYIGVPPYFERPVTLTITDGRVAKIEGGVEADSIKRFLVALKEKLGDDVYLFDTLHFGVHPQAHAAPQQCSSPLYRRMIEHSDTHNIHVHIGSAQSTTAYPYWPHITGDVRSATFKIGDSLMHQNGKLMALEDPAVLAVAAKYPGRPGLGPEPFQG